MRVIFSAIISAVLFTSCATQISRLQPQNLIIEPSRTISSELNEISGLQYDQEVFYGFNDSGGDPTIYTFGSADTQTLHQIKLKNAQNVDWEDIAMSDSLLFLGDFGNNIGNRRDQSIYIVEREGLDTNLIEQEVNPRVVQFFYPEQKDFSNQAYNHDFDMESMVYFKDELHLFTKEWKSEKTHHYTLDLVKGIQPAWLVESFDLGFLATGADIIALNKNKSRLAIVGYNRDGEVFLLLTDIYNYASQWLNQPKSIIKIGEADDLGQVEGVAFKTPKELCISAEAIASDLGNKEQNIRCIRIK